MLPAIKMTDTEKAYDEIIMGYVKRISSTEEELQELKVIRDALIQELQKRNDLINLLRKQLANEMKTGEKFVYVEGNEGKNNLAILLDLNQKPDLMQKTG